jgi:asparagine synthase (glutamine-hydrolysing)
MCGIFTLLNNTSVPLDIIEREFNKGRNRGPEFSKLDNNYMKMILGFHRLAINGLNDVSNQPLVVNNIILICNGEIYNYKELFQTMNITPVTQSDCEVIIHLYIKYGIQQTLSMLDGVYSFVLYDNRITNDLNNKIYIARDPFGVRPLYYLKNKNDKYDMRHNGNGLYGFASELKCLEYFYNLKPDYYSIEQFSPGTYSVFNLGSKVGARWGPVLENESHFIPSFSHTWSSLLINEKDYNNIYYKIASYFNAAITKRCITTERPIACLLSGGLDSSLVAALVNNYYLSHNLPYKLETYSIGLKESEDLKYANIVANYLGTNHTEIIVTEEEMFNAIPEVIKTIESYDTTTVRASIGNYLLGKYISQHSDAKVIFNGDGSDELFGGYLYMHKCPDDIEFDRETRRLLKDIHLFDVLRSDKSISSHGLEPRTPFLDRSFANFILSIPPSFRNHLNKQHCEKFILRNSFASYFIDNQGRQILPDEILWRKKEAFSDGVSSHGRSLFNILQEHIASKMNIENNTDIWKADIDTEKKYYKDLFDSYYPNCSHILPYFWMPKYIQTNDPSARTLSIYKN